MSPRRVIDADTAELFRVPDPQPRRGALALIAAAAAAMMLAAVVFTAIGLANRETEHRASIRDVEVLSFVREFVTQYTSPDPFNANAYADRVLAQGTGQFATLFGDKMNEVVIQVARAERSFGTVQSLGIERWNDDGSANVIAVSTMATKLPDGKTIESGSRWVVTAIKEGDRWKVSNLIQVI